MTERDPRPGEGADAHDGGDAFDRDFEAHFRAITSKSRPAADRRNRFDRSREGVAELAREIEDHYPDTDDPRHLAAVSQQRDRGRGLLESRRRRAVSGSIDSIAPDDEPERDRDARPSKAVQDIEPEDLEARSLDDLNRLLGIDDAPERPAADDDSETIEDDMSTSETSDARAYTPPAKSVDHCTPPVIDRALVRLCPDIDLGGGRFVSGIALDPSASTSGLQIVRAQHYCYGAEHQNPDFPRRDGLAVSWSEIIGGSGIVYINPPYGRVIKHWAAKAIDEMLSAEDLSVIMLLPNRTDTVWFQELVLRPGTAARVCWVHGRLKFLGNRDSAPFGSVVVLYTLDQALADRFDHVFGVQLDEKLERPLGVVTKIAA